jgi:hypothetical protein
MPIDNRDVERERGARGVTCQPVRHAGWQRIVESRIPILWRMSASNAAVHESLPGTNAKCRPHRKAAILLPTG